MKAAAAATLRRLQGARAAQPEEPCVLLLGTTREARESAREALAGSRDVSRAAPDSPTSRACPFRDGYLEGGGVFVELPELLSDVEEVTELATFLRGLGDAHCALLAVLDESEVPDLRSGSGAVEPLPLLAEFYGGELSILVASAPGAAAAGASGATQAAAARLAQRLNAVGGLAAQPEVELRALDPGPGASPEAGALARQAFLAGLRSRPLAACEPLRASSPLLVQYRAIRQKLDLRRPEPPPPPGSGPGGAGRLPPPAGSMSSSSSAKAPPAGSMSPSSSAKEAPRERPPTGESDGGLQLPHRVQWTVMVFGKTGAGKSHLANLLCGHRAFESGDSVASVTNSESVRKASSKDGSVMVLDTIGFGDTRLPMDTVVRSLRDTALEAASGIDALVFVLKKERVTAAEQETLAYVTEDLFGQECLPNLYMVVTHAGRLAKDPELRRPWLEEQAAASEPFRSMLQKLGKDPAERIVFVENSDPAEAEDEEDRALSERRRNRALADVQELLAKHRARPYQHGIMHRAKEFKEARLEEMRHELRSRIESEVREQLQAEKEGLEVERKQLKEQEGDMKKRFEEEWSRMRQEFEGRAKELARGDLESLAQDIVETTEKKAKGRRCSVM